MPELDDITLGNYQIIAASIANSYIPYYKNVATFYSDTKKGVGRVVKEQQGRFIESLGLLARAEGRGHTLITKKELKRLNFLLENIKKNHKHVSKWIAESPRFSKNSEKALEDLGVSPDDLKIVSELSKKKQSIGSRGAGYALRHPFWGGLLGSVGWKGGGALASGTLGLGQHLAGPAAPLVKPALGVAALGTYGLLRAPRNVGRLVRGGQAVGRAVAHPLDTIGRVGRGIGNWFKREYQGTYGEERGSRVGRTASPINEPIPSMRGAISPTMIEGVAPRVGAFRTLGRRKKEEATEPLFYFFNKRAYRAKWTRDVLKALKDKKGGVKLGLGLGKLMLPLIGLTASIGAAGLLLNEVIKSVKEYIDVKKKVKESVDKQKVLQKKFIDKESDEYMEDAREAIAVGDEPTRKASINKVIAVQKRKLELDKPSLYKSWKAGGGLGGVIPGLKELGDRVVGAIKEQVRPAPAASPMSRDSMGQRSSDEDVLIDRISRGGF